MIWASLLRLARSAKPKATFGYREVLKQTLGRLSCCHIAYPDGEVVRFKSTCASCDEYF